MPGTVHIRPPHNNATKEQIFVYALFGQEIVWHQQGIFHALPGLYNPSNQTPLTNISPSVSLPLSDCVPKA